MALPLGLHLVQSLVSIVCASVARARWSWPVLLFAVVPLFDAMSSAPWGEVVTTIPAIQGRSARSPLAGRRVVTQGAVTRVDSDGFFLQDPVGDGDPRSSDAIFVFTGFVPAIRAGQCVRVTGVVVEFPVGTDEPAGRAKAVARTVTELHDVSVPQVLGGECAVTPVDLELPLSAGDDLARFEGMLVTLRGPLMVQQNFFLGRFGQLTLAAGGRVEAPTNRFPPGAGARALAAANARRSVLLDDGSARQDPADTPFLGADGTVRAGDTVAGVTGVVGAGPATAAASGPMAWKIHPTRPVHFARANPRTAAPAEVGGRVKVASANLDNFFSTVSDGMNVCAPGFTTADCRGAHSVAEYERQRAKLVAELAAIDADVVGLMEIENDGATTLQALVDALNARVGRGVYARIDDPAEGSGHDAIKVALIYKPARVRAIGPARSDLDAVHNRAPLAQVFEQVGAAASDGTDGGRLNVIVSHFKSRRCDGAQGPDLDQGDLQGCWNRRRLLQARALHRFAAAVQQRSGVDRTLLIGDFNAYPQEDPIHALTATGGAPASASSSAGSPRGSRASLLRAGDDSPVGDFIDQVARFDPAGYSFVFDGAAGRLDQVLANAALSPHVTGVAAWHVNADEPALLDYTLAFRAPACPTCAPDRYAPTPYRASDHDPVVIGLRLDR